MLPTLIRTKQIFFAIEYELMPPAQDVVNYFFLGGEGVKIMGQPLVRETFPVTIRLH